MFVNSCKWCNNFTVFGRGGKPLANVCQLWERATIAEGNLMKLRARHSFYCLLSDFKMKIVCSICRLKLIPDATDLPHAADSCRRLPTDLRKNMCNR